MLNNWANSRLADLAPWATDPHPASKPIRQPARDCGQRRACDWPIFCAPV